MPTPDKPDRSNWADKVCKIEAGGRDKRKRKEVLRSCKKSLGGISEEAGKSLKYDYRKLELAFEKHSKKAEDPIYKAHMYELLRAGVESDSDYFIEKVSFEEGKSREYIDALKFLAKAGIRVSWGMVDDITLGKAKNKKFLDAVVNLHKAGIKINGMVLSWFYFKSAKQVDDLIKGIKNLKKKLKKKGVEDLDMSYILGYISGPKLQDEEYLDAIVDLHVSGVSIASPEGYGLSILHGLSKEKAKSSEYRASLKILKDVGIRVDNDFVRAWTIGMAKSSKCLVAIKRLNSEGVEIDQYFLKGLTIGKLSKEYVDNVIYLHKAGVKNLSFVLEDLSSWKGLDRGYVEGLVFLNNEGIDLMSFVRNLSLECGRSKVYLQSLMDLSNAGVKDLFLIVDDISLEKGTSKKYIANLIRLIKRGVDKGAQVVKDFPLEKGEDDDYVDMLIDVASVGLFSCNEYTCDDEAIRRVSSQDVENGRYFEKLLGKKKGESDVYVANLRKVASAGVKIDDWFLHAFSLEKGINEKYVKNLIELKKVLGKEFSNRHVARVEFLTNDVFFDLLKKWEGDFRIAGYKYMQVAIGVSDEDMDRLILPDIERGGGRRDYQRSRLMARVPVLNAFYEVKDKYELDFIAEDFVDYNVKGYSLQLVRAVNDFHNDSNEVRSTFVKDLKLEVLYDVVVMGQEELYTSSFRNIIYPIFIKKMQEEGLDALGVVEKYDPKGEKFKSLIQVFSKYDKFGDFFVTIGEVDRREEFLRKIVFGLEAKSNGVENAIALSETLDLLKKDVKILPELEKCLIEAHEDANGNEKILYGIVCSMHKSFAVTNKEFFKKMYEKYFVEDLRAISHEELVNKDGEIIQRYFFYDDKDAQGSYKHMMRHYERDRSWEKEDKGSYVVLSKKNRKTGVTILKYVNKPGKSGGKSQRGQKAINNALRSKDLSVIQIVHRGHSYHVSKTLSYLPYSAKIVFLGSCGGFNNIESVLGGAPKAHIISTKGTGTMRVNDPLLKMLDESMLSGEGIVWNDLWKEAGTKIKNRMFDNYVNPSKNTSAKFIDAYRRHRE